MAAAEAEVVAGKNPENPYVLITQPGVADPSRAPAGQQTLWAYTHVPAGSDVDMTDQIETQIERFAPGFRDHVLARAVRTAAGEKAHNPNYVGGDIAVGMQTLFRPAIQWNPYRTPVRGVYLCSPATPAGPRRARPVRRTRRAHRAAGHVRHPPGPRHQPGPPGRRRPGRL